MKIHSSLHLHLLSTPTLSRLPAVASHSSLHLHLLSTPTLSRLPAVARPSRSGKTLSAILHSSFLILHSSFLILPLSLAAAVPLRWTVETSRVQPVVFDAVRGETLALEASFKSYGTDVSTSNMTATLYWQTNGMASAWWVTNAVTAGTSASVLFTPEMDPGATAIHAFLGLATTNTTLSSTLYPLSSTLYPLSSLSYRAAFVLRFRNGPGAKPNELPLPTPTIDCAQVTFLNPESAPFSGGGGCDTNAVEALISNAVRPISNEVVEIQSNTNITFTIRDGTLTVADRGTNLWSSAGGSTPTAEDKNIAMFIIPVNDNYIGDTWTDFELKASTNNFANDNIAFWAQSTIGKEGFGTKVDGLRMFRCYYGRNYTKINSTAYATVASVVVLVSADLLKRTDGSWLHESNEDLLWVYIRIGGSECFEDVWGDEEPERDSNLLWRPISPVRWFSKLPDWAKDET